MRLKIIVLNLVFLICFSVDRLTKLYFLKTGSVVKNNGVVFGWGNVNIFYYALVIIIILILFRLLLIEYKKNNLAQITLISFILIGALSNLIDRFRFGAVIDWISIPWWSVFNLADIYIVVATIIWCLYIIYGNKKISKT